MIVDPMNPQAIANIDGIVFIDELSRTDILQLDVADSLVTKWLSSSNA